MYTRGHQKKNAVDEKEYKHVRGQQDIVDQYQ